MESFRGSREEIANSIVNLDMRKKDSYNIHYTALIQQECENFVLALPDESEGDSQGNS